MNKLLSLVFCILLLSHTAFGDFNFDSVVSVSTKNDVLRVYGKVELPGQLIFSGTSIKGTISHGNGNFNVDTSLFRIATDFGRFPILNWNYYHGSNSFGGGIFNISGSALAAAYFPTYVVEYVEKNGVDGLQIGEDEIVGHINLAQYQYDVDLESEVLETSNGEEFNVYHVTVTSANKVFQMNFTLAGSPVEVNGNRISAEQTKIDIGIYNYYDSSVNQKSGGISCLFTDLACLSTGPSEQESSLALLSFFAAANLELDIDGEGQISVQNGNEGLYAGFNYASTAKVSKDSDSVTVNANVYTNVTGNDGGIYGSGSINALFSATASHKFIVQSFEGIRPSVVEYDPTVGGASTDFQNNSSIKVVSSFVLVALLSLLVLLL